MNIDDVIAAMVVRLGEPGIRGTRGGRRGNTATASWGHATNRPHVNVELRDGGEWARVQLLSCSALKPTAFAVAETIDDFAGRVVRGELAGVTVVPLAVAVQAAALTLGLARTSRGQVLDEFVRAFGRPDVLDENAARWKKNGRVVSVVSDRCDVNVVLRDSTTTMLLVAETTDDPGFVECRTADEARRTSGRCTLAVAIEAAMMFRECGHPWGAL
mgnify:CR=1 FL=1